MNCDEVRDRLLEFAEGELRAAESAALRAHVRDCAACAIALQQTRDALGALGEALHIESEEAAGETRASAVDPLDAGATRRIASPGPPGTEPNAGGLRPAAARQDQRSGGEGSSAARRIADFELIEELGRGGMGVVYRARQVSLNRVVALKVLSAALLASPRAGLRFQKEARAAARLHHTNIVPIYAQGEYEGLLYYAMEMVDGPPLSAVLEHDPIGLRHPANAAPAAGGADSIASMASSGASTTRTGAVTRRARDFKRIARLIAEVADALQHAHDEGIVHRDVKPQNLLMGRDDRLHVTDFGLARLLDEPGLTISAEMVGTPAYASPEQLIAGRPLDFRTDIFSLGVTLYELLTLRRPFTGGNIDQLIRAILTQEPPAPRRVDPRIPLDLETICLRALEKEPHRRFPSAAAMSEDLRRYAQDFPIASRRISPLGRAWRWVQRNPTRAALGATAGLLMLLAPLLVLTARSRADQAYQSAYEALLGDYRDSAGARAILQRAWIPGADVRSRELALAVADVMRRPEQALARAGRWLAEHPRDAEFHYLSAWAHRREGRWREAQRCLADGDASSDAATRTPGALFWRGQAVLPVDPEAAIRSYAEAMSGRRDFVQAMVMQGRAATHLMYALGNDEWYRTAESSLLTAGRLQSDKARPRYYLALCHLWAAITAAERGDAAAAEERFTAAELAAREAQRVEPGDASGCNAEALILERRGDLRGAAAAWQRSPPMSPSGQRELYFDRGAYAMRLHFWLGETADAERYRRARYEFDGADRLLDDGDRFDAAWYEAMIWAAEDQPRAVAALQRASTIAADSGELRLLVDGASRILAIEVPVLPASELHDEVRLSRGWSAIWVRTLRSFMDGDVDWETLQVAVQDCADAPAGEASPTERQRRRRLLAAGAEFYRGVLRIDARDRESGMEAFAAAARLNDEENYCFRARFIHGGLRHRADWPTGR
ncbi:MAG: protein kinase [Planctomycetia bacterium]|nr:MAG: protein kinase [Planctomycetia bacterium]